MSNFVGVKKRKNGEKCLHTGSKKEEGGGSWYMYFG